MICVRSESWAINVWLVWRHVCFSEKASSMPRLDESQQKFGYYRNFNNSLHYSVTSHYSDGLLPKSSSQHSLPPPPFLFTTCLLLSSSQLSSSSSFEHRIAVRWRSCSPVPEEDEETAYHYWYFSLFEFNAMRNRCGKLTPSPAVYPSSNTAR